MASLADCLPPHSLAQAFALFEQAAGSLKSSYGQLQLEIARLRRELEERNRDLAQSLQENERIRAYLVRIMEGLPCGVLVLDGDGRVQISNPAARRLLASEPDGLSEAPSPLEEILPHLLAGIRFAEPGMEQAWSVERRDGIVHLAVTRALLPGLDGLMGDAVFILRDVTQEKRLEKERETARRMQALAEMSTLLAHEIRNPLASLELFAGLLADATEGQAETRGWVDHLQAGLRALSATVNNVLQFHGQPPPQLVTVDLRLLLRETIEFLAPLARRGGMRIEFLECQDDLFLRADPHRLQQVFFNLALNAFRVMPEGGIVRVSAGQEWRGEEQRVEILFQDQGPGIDPDKLESIFEPGFTTSPGSPGLGLAVSKKIVEQHGGKILVQSAPGQGATFNLEFPVRGAER